MPGIFKILYNVVMLTVVVIFHYPKCALSAIKCFCHHGTAVIISIPFHMVKATGAGGPRKPKTLKVTKRLQTELQSMIAFAVDEARRIDEASMAKHNREATIISMILGFTCLALFVDGLLRILGIIPPFMHIDVNILDRIADRVETDVIDKISEVKTWFND